MYFIVLILKLMLYEYFFNHKSQTFSYIFWIFKYMILHDNDIT